MAKTTQIVGLLLIVVGVIGYIATDAAHWTALLPAVLGLLIAVLGLVGGRVEGGHHAIHVALVIALLGALGALPRLGGLADGDAAALASLATVLVCAVFIALGVRSFAAARRARQGTDA